jgi:hypothetical protein
MKTYKELMEETLVGKHPGFRRHMIQQITAKKDTSNPKYNVSSKETDEYYETHFDSDHGEGLITRTHKKTGKVEKNHHTIVTGRNFGGTASKFAQKKNPNGEFK